MTAPIYSRRGAREPTVEPIPIRLYGIARESIVDGPRLRFVVFTQGCPHKCPGCHNPGSYDPAGGFDSDVAKIFAEYRKNPLLRGITFSGGEPFLWGHALAALGRAVRETGGDVMVYSGWTYEQLLVKAESESGVRELLEAANYLVDGPYIAEQRDLSLQYRGSRNQRILDVTCYPNSTRAAVVEFDRSGRAREVKNESPPV